MNKGLNVLELFGGIGAFHKALVNLKIPHETVGYVEVNKNCTKAFNTLYNESFSPMSVEDYRLPKNQKVDILMHGSPCQDFSVAGKRQGGHKGSGTRSSLLFETIRIVEEAELKPTWVIWENVAGVLHKNMKDSFFMYIDEMSRLGYTTKYQLLNAMDFGIPQKRIRVFAISYYGNINVFDFERLEKSETRAIKEFLEDDVLENKYIVKQQRILNLIHRVNKDDPFNKRVKFIDDYARTITRHQMRIPNSGLIDLGNGKYRYLTERECFRLMGFNDGDFDQLKSLFPPRKNCCSGILYGMAGNSIVVDVLESIIKELMRVTDKY